MNQIISALITAVFGILGIFLGMNIQQHQEARKSVMYPINYDKLSRRRFHTNAFIFTTIILSLVLLIILFYEKSWYNFVILLLAWIFMVYLCIEHLHDPTDSMPKIPSFEHNNRKFLVINTLSNNRILVVPDGAFEKAYYPSEAYVLEEDILLGKEVHYTTIVDKYKPGKPLLSKVISRLKKDNSKLK
ncbi:hypothetical protein GBP19_06200 [Pediococcus acidilactici]|uniref:hypothetical protein n=1 Tax=Pediococcus acidilactici TaxID=1254 RepID=UPI00132FEAC6|nr:hypothetical protein [Pediococcus acidilactici]KAF0499281.1 hypothetical protein GBP19_06200 [Pediococcus acidilactici]